MIINSLRILIVVTIIKNFISVCQTYYGVTPIFGVHLVNLHRFLAIPFFMTCMYSYKVFVNIARDMLEGTFPKVRGMLVFLQFIFIKTIVPIFATLTDFSVIPCVPPNIPPVVVSYLMTAISNFLFSFILGLVLAKLYRRTWTLRAKTDTLLVEKLDTGRVANENAIIKTV